MEGKTLGIIGYGAFGSFVHELATRYLPALSVKVYSPSLKEGIELVSFEEAASCDFVIPAVPIHSLVEVFEKIAAIDNPNRIVIDIATVKTHTVSLLHAHRGKFRYSATHPMFGPYSYHKKRDSLKNLRLVICEHSLSVEEIQQAQSFFEKLGIIVKHLTADEHDRMLAETLFLTHLIGQAVTVGGFRRTEIDTVSFGFLMDAVESVQNDTALFKDVFMYNPYCREVINAFKEALERVEETLTQRMQ